MAKVTKKPGITKITGSINSAAVARIIDPAAPIIFTDRKTGTSIHQGKFGNRKVAKGGQGEIRTNYCNCAAHYKYKPGLKEEFRHLAQQHNRENPDEPPISGYNMWMQICLHTWHDMSKICSVVYDSPYETTKSTRLFCNGYSFQRGNHVIECEGWYAPWPPSKGQICNDINPYPWEHKIGAECYYQVEPNGTIYGLTLWSPYMATIKLWELEQGKLKRFFIQGSGPINTGYRTFPTALHAQSKYTIYKIADTHSKWKDLFFLWW